jgi:3-methyladenine DNA glycosylase AlkC
MTETGRRIGARSRAVVDGDVLRDLERGRLSTATHVEHMSIDQATLWSNAFPYLRSANREFDGQRFIGKLRIGGRLLYEALGDAAWSVILTEPDTVLAWRAFAVAAAARDLDQQLDALAPFAEHHHFAVREWAWLALRGAVSNEPARALETLCSRIESASAYWRRFACEVTRPRSVWGAHIPSLKARPMVAEPFLALLLADTTPYVSTSATNWLNDVSKTHVAWVTAMCTEYGGDRSTKLIARATRSSHPRSPSG